MHFFVSYAVFIDAVIFLLAVKKVYYHAYLPLFGMIYSHSTLSQLSLLDISLKFYEEKLQNKRALEHRQCISLQ